VRQDDARHLVGIGPVFGRKWDQTIN
jgi:hypothetical protein